ncbi:hypothetical protein HDV06_001046 [Boothiomyces sp. JEL0866]|nr:hypothetical protein HDV06_001046 [Boothiomyces sp. JEL0866]
MDIDTKVLFYLLLTTLLLFYKKKKNVETEIRDLLIQESRHSKQISRSLLILKLLIILKTIFVIATFTSNIVLLTMDLDLQSFILYAINSVFIFGLVVSNLKLKFSFDLKTSIEYRDFGCILDGMVSEPLDTVLFEFYVVLTQCYIILFEFGYLNYLVQIIGKIEFSYPPVIPELPPLPNLPELNTKNLIIVGYPVISILNLIISKYIQLWSRLVDRILLNNTEPKRFGLFYTHINELLSIGSELLLDEFDQLYEIHKNNNEYVIELPDQIEEGLGINEQTPLLDIRTEKPKQKSLFAVLLHLNHNLLFYQQLVAIIPLISSICIPIVLAMIINDCANICHFCLFLALLFAHSVCYNYTHYLGRRISIRINTVILKLSFENNLTVDLDLCKNYFAKLFKLWFLPLQFMLISGYMVYLDSKCILFTIILLLRFIVNIGFEHVYEYRKTRNIFYQTQLEHIQRHLLENYIDLVIFQLKPNIDEFVNFKKQSLLSLSFWKNIQYYFNIICSPGSIALLLIYYTMADKLSYNTMVLLYLFKYLSNQSLELNSILSETLQVLEAISCLKFNQETPKDVLIKSNLGIHQPNFVLHIYPNTCFQYHSDEKFTLRYNGKGLTLPKGGLTIICGDAASGKTTFLKALRSKLLCTSGGIYFGQSIIDEPTPMAFCSQKPWLLSSTIRENIIFGEEFETERYYRTLSCCDLISDIQEMPNQDFTLVYETDLNASFVQRICLARAIYSNSNLILLDDSLEAIEKETKKSIFDRAICGFLTHKTRILVTNDVELFEKADLVINITKGIIKPIRKFNVQFAENLDPFVYQKEVSLAYSKTPFFRYLKAAGGPIFPVFFPLLVCITQMSLFICDLFVIVLVDFLPKITDDKRFHLELLLITYFATLSCIFVLQMINHYGGTLGSNRIQTHTFNSLFKNSLQTIAELNIYGYFAIDYSLIDEYLMDNVQKHLSSISSVLIFGIFSYLIFDCLISSIVGVLLLGVLFFVLKYFGLAANVNEKADQLKKSLIKQVTDSELATDIASAFCKTRFVKQKLYQDIDNFNRTLMLETAALCWISLRIDLVFGCMLGVIFSLFQKEEDSFGLQLFMIIVLLFLPSEIKNWLSNYLQMVSNFHEVTKTDYFSSEFNTPKSLPARYQLDAQNVTIVDLGNQIVLSNVNIQIVEGERIGIIVDDEAIDCRSILKNCSIAEGIISLGGVNITELSHSEIFKCTSLIPKEFAVTCPVREFIDPNNEHSEQEIIEILNLLHLQVDHLDTLEAVNDHIMKIHLAKAYLNTHKIIILEKELDNDIETILNEYFSYATIIHLSRYPSATLCKRTFQVKGKTLIQVS